MWLRIVSLLLIEVGEGWKKRSGVGRREGIVGFCSCPVLFLFLLLLQLLFVFYFLSSLFCLFLKLSLAVFKCDYESGSSKEIGYSYL